MSKHDLPSGTVTFLFTDIEGSTKLLDELGSERYAAALGQHRKIIRDACVAHGGVEVDRQGDSFFFAFPTAPGAMQAAVALTSRLAPGPIRVRVGLHTGTPMLVEEGYIGADVHRAARIAAAGHGGQVLVSAATAPLIEAQLLDLGEHRFKDLTNPERVYQLGRDRYPPLKTLHRTHRREMAQSIAVLPFEVVGAAQEAEFLAAGLHSGLMAALSRAPELTVISRTSVMAYKGTDKPLPHITAELNVGTIVEGTVQSAGGRVRLTVQLIDGVEDVHRWAHVYDREVTTDNLFAIQSELTQQIAESLHAQLRGEDGTQTGPATQNLDAYRLAAEGRLQLDRRTEDGFQRAIRLFEEAVSLDPDFAIAWVGLADSLALMEDYGFGDSEALLARAQMAVRRALELAPDSAEAYASLGLILFTRQDAPTSLRELELAIEIQPGYAEASSWHAWVSLLAGHPDAALRSATEAVRRNPLSPEAINHLGLSFMALGDNHRGLNELRRAGQLSAGFSTTDYYQGICLYELGHYDEAVRLLTPLASNKAGRLTVPWAELGPDVALALALQASGDSGAARDVMAGVDRDEHPFWIGLIHAALGERETALDAVSRVDHVGAGATLVVRYHFRSVWRLLVDDPRYAGLVQVVHRSWGLETPSVAGETNAT